MGQVLRNRERAQGGTRTSAELVLGCFSPKAPRALRMVLVLASVTSAWGDVLAVATGVDPCETWREASPAGLVLSGDRMVLARGVVAEVESRATDFLLGGEAEVGGGADLTWQVVDEARWIQRDLFLERMVGAEAAALVLFVDECPGVLPAISINGYAVRAEGGSSVDLGPGTWWRLPLPLEHLRAGRNRIELYAEEPAARFRVLVAPASAFSAAHGVGDAAAIGLPGLSSVSQDAGRTWKRWTTPVPAGALSEEDALGGELVVRLYLDSYRSRGRVDGPVVRVSSGDTQAETPRSLEIRWAGEVPLGTTVELEVRTGDTEIPERGRWTDWLHLGERSTAIIVSPAGAYAQWRISLATLRGDRSPALDWVQWIPELTLNSALPARTSDTLTGAQWSRAELLR